MFETIVSARQLHENLHHSDWVIIDVRFDLMQPGAGFERYCSNHIPQAFYAHLDHDLSSPIKSGSGRHPLPEPEVFARKARLWGVDGSTQIVVYDDRDGAIAARLWWLFRWLGHKSVAVLNGGFSAWQRAGYSLDTDHPAKRMGNFSAQLNSVMQVDTDFILHGLNQSRYLLIDARAEERFRGKVEPIDSRAGHVPGAVNVPYQGNLDEMGCLLPAEVLQARYAAVMQKEKSGQVICMCGSGVTACHSVLTLEIAGFPGARLYAGSWSEWIRDPMRPVAQG